MADSIRVSGKEIQLPEAKGNVTLEKRPGGILVATGGDGVRRRVFVHETAREVSWNVAGRSLFGRKSEKARGARAGVAADLSAQFPGKVRKILVREGQKVEEGEKLLLVEAMKMEFAVLAPVAGTVGKIRVAEGQQLQPGDLFLDFKAGVPG